jgi:hypothetical protein
MKNFLRTKMATLLFFVLVFFSEAHLLALSKEKSGGRGRPRFHPYGLGLIFGEPSGISGKAWLSRIMAIDGGLGWSFIDDTAIHLHGDVLFHHKPFSPHHGDFYFYGGLGARVRSGNSERTGIRVPLGIEFMLIALPLDFFVEIVPILELASSEDIGINTALGIRWMF